MINSRRWIALLAFTALAIAAVACRTPGEADPIPAPGDASPFTAEEVMQRTLRVMEDEISIEAVGGFLAYRTDVEDEPELTQVTMEWTAPDRARRLIRQTSEAGTFAVEFRYLGDSAYVFAGAAGGGAWSETQIERQPGDDEQNRPTNLKNLLISDSVQVADYNGRSAYLISGEELVPEQELAPGIEQEIEIGVTLVIDALSFRVLRDERIQTVRITEDVIPNAPGDSSVHTEEVVVEAWLDMTYPGRALSIEPPEEFVSAG